MTLLVAALVAAAPGTGAQERSANNQVVEVENDVMFSTTGEVIEYIDVAEDFDGQFQPYIVPAASFTSDGFDPDSSFFSFFGGFVRGNAANDGCLKAPIQLPDGATIVNLFGYLYDDDVSRNITLNLRRKRNGTTDSSETLASVTSSGDSTSVQIPGDTSVVSDVVNNGNYSYFLTACLGSGDTQINGAWIFTEPADDTFEVYGPEAKMSITPTGPTDNRVLLEMVNFGRTSFKLQDVTENNGWVFGTRGNGFEINRAGSGGTEFRFFDNGRVTMGPGVTINFDLSASGNLEIQGTLTENSDRNAKANVRSVDPHAVLAAVEGLEISTWQYRSDPSRVRHLGPMAQDFYAAFGLGGTDTGIATIDTSGVALASIQALAERNAELEDRVAELEAMVSALLDQ